MAHRPNVLAFSWGFRLVRSAAAGRYLASIWRPRRIAEALGLSPPFSRAETGTSAEAIQALGRKAMAHLKARLAGRAGQAMDWAQIDCLKSVFS